jgi:putative NADPH-quinone reductase
VVVTMGMPSLLYRWFYRAHSLKSLERNILAFVGFAPVRSNVIGMVEAPDGARREKWLATMRKLGARAV